MDTDPIWEYNAPQFVDFSRPMEDDPGVDQYFDIDHENENVLNGDHVVPEEQRTGDHGQGCVAEEAVVCSELEAKASKEDALGAAGAQDAAASHEEASTPVPPATTKQEETTLMSNDQNCLAQSAAPSQNEECAKDSEVGEVLPNVCASLDQWRSKATKTLDPAANVASKSNIGSSDASRATASRPKPQQLPKKDEDSGTQPDEKKNTASKCIPRPRTRSLDRGKLVGPGLKASGSDSTETVTVASSSRRRSQSQERHLRPASPAAKIKKELAGKLTLPSTPSFMKRELKFMHVNQAKPAEEQEMDKIRELRKALAERRKMAAESRVTALAATGYEPVRSRLPVTRPQEFQFASDARLKGHPMEGGPAVAWKEVDFTAELRKHHDPAAAPAPHGPTVPHPFNLHVSRKRTPSAENLSSDRDKYETMAEKVRNFASRTPDRFRTKPTSDRRSAGGLSKNVEPGERKLTVPKTPTLVARSRSRPVTVMSQAEMEEIEVEEMKQKKFKAMPFNPKIFENPKIGVKPVAPKECTVPEGFDLEIDKRFHQRKRHHSESKEPQHEFHAQPVPKKLLLGPVGLKPAKEIPLTIPQSPAFASRNLPRPIPKTEELDVDKDLNVIRARPVPHTGIPFQPKLDHHATVVEPFSFEERTKEMLNKKEEQIRKVLEEEKKAREFHANPLKDLQPVLPEKKPKAITTPEPFNLEIEARCAARVEEWKQKVEEENKKLKLAAAFKAKPPAVLMKEAFLPAKSSKPLTEINDLQLNTEKRAEKRQEWEAWNNEKVTELAHERVQREKAKMEEAELEVQRLRAEAVPKANPVRHYKPVQIVPSNQPLTRPESPRFSERLKAKTVHD